MQVELDDENFFILPNCHALWNLFKKNYILPFMYEKMLDFNYKINHNLESNLKINEINTKFYQELLYSWKNYKGKDCNMDKIDIYTEMLKDINIYLDFLSDFIIEIILKDSIKRYLKLQDSMYKYIESLFLKKLYVEIIFVDNENMQKINKEYMSKDYPTDVLSFPLVTQDIEINQCLGSIIINMYEVCDKADFYKHNIYAEISLLFIHAFLHILGFDHEKDDGTQRLIEQEIITTLNLPKSLILRAE